MLLHTVKLHTQFKVSQSFACICSDAIMSFMHSLENLQLDIVLVNNCWILRIEKNWIKKMEKLRCGLFPPVGITKLEDWCLSRNSYFLHSDLFKSKDQSPSPSSQLSARARHVKWKRPFNRIRLITIKFITPHCSLAGERLYHRYRWGGFEYRHLNVVWSENVCCSKWMSLLNDCSDYCYVNHRGCCCVVLWRL